MFVPQNLLVNANIVEFCTYKSFQLAFIFSSILSPITDCSLLPWGVILSFSNLTIRAHQARTVVKEPLEQR